MPFAARLSNVLLALLFLTAMALVDLRPQFSAASDPAVSAQSVELEDGPEGESSPLATFLRSYDGDDQIGSGTLSIRVSQICYDLARDDIGRDAAGPSHPPCAGYPTGPPRA